ncbi:MAG: hypothetical protein IKN55_10735 [Oscillospiraceae bacterium]|nr:hypothetical protein [Oscillospiraceae bacterium]
MDQFAEMLVKKLPSSKDDLKRALIITGAAVITLGAVALVFIGYPLALVLPVCAIWAAVYLMRMTNVEYEYSVTNGSLDIDKILGQNKRRSMLSIDVGSFTVYGRAGEVSESDAEMTTFLAGGVSLMGEDDDAEEYYAEFDHPEHGKCCLYFTPDSRFREALEPFLSRTLRQELKRRNAQ